jgi:Domain of unknown function (DUF4287)
MANALFRAMKWGKAAGGLNSSSDTFVLGRASYEGCKGVSGNLVSVHTQTSWMNDDNIYAKAGRVPEEYRKMAKEKGLIKHGGLLNWLKTECGLGHGHANVIILYIKDPELGKKKIAEDAKNEKAKTNKSKSRRRHLACKL